MPRQGMTCYDVTVFSIETVGPCHQQVQSRARVTDHPTASRRTAESTAFSVPDRNALWIRVEDDLLNQAAAHYSTSDVLGRDWREVASEMPGRLP